MSIQAPRRELDDFLFAAIGEERNGMMLTVVSALGRLGLDPWREAERLAAMPKGPAVQQLSPMLARLPERLWDAAEVQAIATRLVALLPSASRGEVVDETPRPHSLASWLLCAALFAAVSFAMASGREFSLLTFVGSAPQASLPADGPQSTGR